MGYNMDLWKIGGWTAAPVKNCKKKFPDFLTYFIILNDLRQREDKVALTIVIKKNYRQIFLKLK